MSQTNRKRQTFLGQWIGQPVQFGKRRASTPKRYGTINRRLFSSIKGDAQIYKTIQKAARFKKRINRSQQASAAQYGIQLRFDPEVFLVNPLADVKDYLARFLGGNLAFAVRDRVVLDGRGADGKEMRHFFLTGGMWKGFDARGNEKTAKGEFYKSSFSSNAVFGYLRSNPDLTLDELKRAFRKRRARSRADLKMGGGDVSKAWSATVRNRRKAWSCQESEPTRAILEPSKAEVDAMFAYMHDLLELRVMIGDVSHVPKKQRATRARRLVKALGKIKAPQIRIN